MLRVICWVIRNEVIYVANDGKENLIVPSSEEARKNGRKGGIASGKARKQKKLMSEVANDILQLPLKSGTVDEIKNLAEVRGLNITVQEAILISMVKKALKGDPKAAAYVRDTAGQMPTNNIELKTEVSSKLADIMEQLKGE